MARKCGRCRGEGHTITTCTEASDVMHAGEDRPAPDHVHSFTWADDGNGHSGSQCVGCGEPDTAAAKAERTVVSSSGRCDGCGTVHAGLCPTDPKPEHVFNDGAGGTWRHPGVKDGCTLPECQPEPDPWDEPSPPAPELNASGQPSARYEWHGKQNRGYLVKDPATGDFRRYKNGKPRGWTRATTFNKAATDQNSLTDWAKRNVLIGAARRPDLVSKAHGLTHETGKGELMSLVSELEKAAGALVSAQVGTDIHELTERWDAGQLKPEDIPAMYRDTLELYQRALNQAGLRPVPGLIERTTVIQEFGGIVGTMDRVYLHEASGQYVIGDVKTGKTLEYGMDEIETQEWIYAHGVNENGVYDWNTDMWERAKTWDGAGHRKIKVSEEWGIVVHLPVQGPDAGTCKLVRADLQRGMRHAQVCHDVRVQRSSKPKPELWTGDELKAATWEATFLAVTSKEQASSLWVSARQAGVTGLELNRLVEMAQKRLRELGVS